MKSSYTNVSQIEINVDLGINEIETIITVLEAKAEGDNGWQVKDLLRQLKATKAESIRQIRDSLKNLRIKQGPFGALHFCPLRSSPAPRARDPAPRARPGIT